MPTPEHNPQSIPPSEIPPGWRLCRESERGELPADAKIAKTGAYSMHSASSVPMSAWRKFTYITATPLPESEHEVPAASPWIPLSEREPTKDDWDATHVVEAANSSWREVANKFMPQPWCGNYTHWRRVELPPLPPAPAKTQIEKDEAAFQAWDTTTGLYTSRSGFYGALETERAHFGGRSAEEVKAEIQLYHRGAAEARALLAHLEKGQRVCDERKANIILRMIACGEVQELRALLSPPKEGETKHE